MLLLRVMITLRPVSLLTPRGDSAAVRGKKRSARPSVSWPPSQQLAALRRRACLSRAPKLGAFSAASRTLGTRLVHATEHKTGSRRPFSDNLNLPRRPAHVAPLTATEATPVDPAVVHSRHNY